MQRKHTKVCSVNCRKHEREKRNPVERWGTPKATGLELNKDSIAQDMEERKGFLPYIERKAENMEVYIIMAAVAAAMLIISGLALFGFALIKKAFDGFLD